MKTKEKNQIPRNVYCLKRKSHVVSVCQNNDSVHILHLNSPRRSLEMHLPSGPRPLFLCFFDGIFCCVTDLGPWGDPLPATLRGVCFPSRHTESGPAPTFLPKVPDSVMFPLPTKSFLTQETEKTNDSYYISFHWNYTSGPLLLQHAPFNCSPNRCCTDIV